MAKTGPQRYPGASTAYWYQGKYGGTAMESNVGVIHTTEGRTVPSYGNGASAPNFTALPDIKNRRLRWYQHFDFDASSRALVNLRGGVETNTLNAVQVELVGTCDERHAKTWDGKVAGRDYLFWPDAPDWALAELGKFVRWASDHHGIRMQSTVTWKAYKRGQVGGSYGANGVRLSGAAWLRYYGWLGHQHVPENSHGDPGDINFARVLEHARGSAAPTAPQEDAMPHSLGEYETTDYTLTEGRWTAVELDGDPDLLTGPAMYQAMAHLTARMPAGATIQGRFFHARPGRSRWEAGICERLGTSGLTFADFHNSGSILTGERLRFEAVYYRAADTDPDTITVTTTRLRGLYWK